MAVVRRIARWIDDRTRPTSRELEARLARRWDGLPPGVRHAAQSIGRRTMGCEGTHGVFPRCNLACTPCYHSREANRVRTSGPHTLRQVERQTAMLRRRRGPGQNAQLIGGEVTLLHPDDHARALLLMRRRGRKPMSMSHGDFELEHLRRIALGPGGRRRLDHLIFAGHFDSLMLGRRGAPAPGSEADLHVHRARFCRMFARLRRESGVTSYLAHNMTVTPANAPQIPEVVGASAHMGFRMLSFQPAAFQGNPRRWRERYRDLGADEVWRLMERGAGGRLPYRAIQTGDERCNRTAYGAYVGRRWVALLDDRDPRDLRAREAFHRTFAGMDVEVRARELVPRLARAFLTHPASVPLGLGHLARFARRAGAGALLKHRVRPVTFVMHRFMDAADVSRAWALLERGRTAEDPRLRETQERLLACSYHMAHPETGRLVPACAQHAVLGPEENRRLAELLPLRGAAAAGVG